MFSGWCGPMGVTGWIAMAVLWTALIAVVVWAIARLFPERPAPPPPPTVDESAGAGKLDDVTSVGGGRG